jgi:hypothetical protein
LATTLIDEKRQEAELRDVRTENAAGHHDDGDVLVGVRHRGPPDIAGGIEIGRPTQAEPWPEPLSCTEGHTP